MNVAKTYGDQVRKRLETRPDRAGAWIRRGLQLESFRTAHFPDKRMPRAYRYLNHMAIKVVADALDHPDTFVWTNIFAPVEIMQTFDLTCVSMECLASYLSGFWIEDALIDCAEQQGIAPTLCSYHKNFLGAVASGTMPRAVAGITTSMVCDGNMGSFRFLERAQGVPTSVIDVPHSWSQAGEDYVVAQLEELIAQLERWTGRPFDEARLVETLERENRTKELYLEFLDKRREHYYPMTLTLHMFVLFATHLSIGSEWALRFAQMLVEDIERQPAFEGKRFFWVHLVPWSHPTLCEYFNYNERYSIVADDFNLDYIEPLDVSDPLRALARKMIGNIYNGDVERKLDAVERYVERYGCDAVVELCHWGCKQSCGAAPLVKERMRRAGVPMLVIDGDGIDRRNHADGQTRTRFEAFLELLESGEGTAR